MKNAWIKLYQFSDLDKRIQEDKIAEHLNYYIEDRAYEHETALFEKTFWDIVRKHKFTYLEKEFVDLGNNRVCIRLLELAKLDLPDELKYLLDVETISEVTLIEHIELSAQKTTVSMSGSDNRLKALEQFVIQLLEPLRKEFREEYKNRKKQLVSQLKDQEKEAIKELSKHYYSRVGKALPECFLESLTIEKRQSKQKDRFEAIC